MNLEEIHQLPPHHRANAERQLREQNALKLQGHPQHPYVEVLNAISAAATKKPGISNGFSQTVLTAWLLDRGIGGACYEFKFHETRKWRFDLAWPVFKVALEVQGGLFTHGAHVRGAALLREHCKLNEAAALGWRILYRTPSNLMTSETAELIGRALA